MPSSAPYNITVDNFASENFVTINWRNIPAQDWNGTPLGIALYYRVIRRGSEIDLHTKMKMEWLNFDQTQHKITGLDVNWALSAYLVASTGSGEGPNSATVTGG